MCVSSRSPIFIVLTCTTPGTFVTDPGGMFTRFRNYSRNLGFGFAGAERIHLICFARRDLDRSVPFRSSGLASDLQQLNLFLNWSML